MRSLSVPPIPAQVVTTTDLTRKAFLSHEGKEKQTILSVLRAELHRHGISDDKVFYDDYMKRGGNKDEDLKNRLTEGLLASECLIVFLTPDFLKKRWPMWELRTFLDMMEKDERRKLLPVFYEVSARECGDIVKQRQGECGQLKECLGLSRSSAELRGVLQKVKQQIGIDAKGQRVSHADIVFKIMKDVFDVDIQNKRATANVASEGHKARACKDPLCDDPRCMRRIIADLDKNFATPPLPKYSRLDFENPTRPEKILREKLLSRDRSSAVFGVKAMGGVGKTTCLIGVANDPHVKKVFPDGILWVQLSMDTKIEDMREIFVNILKYAWYHWKDRNVEGALNAETSLDYIVGAAREALKEKSCLIVVDDFWPFDEYRSAISHFTQILSPSCTILLSTRHSEVVAEFNADEIPIGDLDDETASSLFDDWCGGEPTGEEEEKFKKEILGLCSNMALAVCIAGSNVRRIAESEGRKRGLERVLGDLSGNLGNLQGLDHSRKYQTLNAAIQTSLNSIRDEGHRNEYYCLAVFKNKTQIPYQALEALWYTDPANVAARVDLYLSCSLATRKISVESGRKKSFYVEFHDQHLEYARYSLRAPSSKAKAVSRHGEEEEELVELHRRLVDGYKRMCDDVGARVWWEAKLLNDGYFHENFAYHLAGSRRVEDLVGVVMDYRWIALRCRRQEMRGLLSDFDIAISALRALGKGGFLDRSGLDGARTGSYERSAADDLRSRHENEFYAVSLVRKALLASQVVLLERTDEVSFQLVGRLLAHSKESALIKGLVDGAQRWELRPWLCPMTQCLESPTRGAFQVLPSSSPVLAVAVCREKPHIVVCGTLHGYVDLWDWSTGRCVWSQSGHEGLVMSLAIAQDGSFVVSGSDDKTVRLWDVESGECKKVFRGHDDEVSSVAVKEDGSLVVSGSRDKTVRLWNVGRGECRSVLRGHKDKVSSVALTKDGNVVVSGSRDKTIRLWSVERDKCKRVLRGHKGTVSSVAVTKDGNVVSGSLDKTVRLWNVESGKCKRVLPGLKDEVSSLAVTEDGNVIVSGSCDETVRLWNVESGKCKNVFRGHREFVKSVAVTEGRNVVVSGSLDKTIRLWDEDSGECKNVLRGHEDDVRSLAMTEDGSIVVSGSWDETIRLWNVESGDCTKVLRGHEDGVRSVTTTKDGNIVVSGSWDKTVRLWNVESGECKNVLRRHKDVVSSVALTEDGNLVVSGSLDTTVRLWSVKSGKCKHVFRGHKGGVSSVAVAEGGNIVVSGSLDMTVRLWNVKVRKRKSNFRERESVFRERKSVFRGHESAVSSVAVMRDGNTVVSGSLDTTVRLWDVESGKCKNVLRGHKGEVTSTAVTEGGNIVVSGSRDKTVRLWNVESGECLRNAKWCVNYGVTLGSRDLLFLAQSVGLLATDRETSLSGPDNWSPLPEGSEIKVEYDAVRVVHGQDTQTVMSATFDGKIQFALLVNFKGKRRLVGLKRPMLILEIKNPQQLRKEFCN